MRRLISFVQLSALLALLSARGTAIAATDATADICIYGGTSAGVIAAVQAAQLGHTVLLVEAGQHLGA